ncbi:MAG: PucR family transcriptional regulator ligand-binding domain-containing protein [Butyrivibrio sp.]|nr:PucR family transcriptional regulator ligand-binding domain-containing protein [Butyrivibrio sp.]
MAVELKRLIEKVANYDITLIAGKSGINRAVSWVHMVENEEAACFLDGYEVAFLTGVGIVGKDTLLSLIKAIYENNATGVIINIGPFIEEIPDDVIEFCDANNFPLFSVPWKIHLAEIIKIFCFTISKDDQSSLQIASAFKNAILFPKQEELYMVYLSQNGFLPSWCYNVCSIKLYDSNGEFLPLSRLELISVGLDNYLSHHKHKNYACFSNNDEILVIIANHSDSECHSMSDDILSYLNKALPEEEKYLIGIGRATKSVRCLFKSHNQAHAIQKLNQNGQIDSTMFSYSEMGIYRLLIGIEDSDIITDYYNKTIAPLEAYDDANNSDLCKILRSYLFHNGSVKDTADELFVHRNTINYKLTKISDILDVDLSCLETRVQLYLAFMIKNIM